MKPASTRLPQRLRGALLALSIAVMATQVSGASAAAQMGGARLGAPVAAAARAPLTVGRPQPSALASLSPVTPMSSGWALLVAGLTGAWAIGHRRMSVLGSRSLDPHGLRRR